jgi:hypothetical protein
MRSKVYLVTVAARTIRGSWVASGFSVKPSRLQSGSQEMASLQGTSAGIADDVFSTLSAMAGAAGHPGLAAALQGAAGTGNQACSGMCEAYGHLWQGLAGSSQIYAGTDLVIAQKVSDVGSSTGPALAPGTFIGGPKL